MHHISNYKPWQMVTEVPCMPSNFPPRSARRSSVPPIRTDRISSFSPHPAGSCWRC